MDTETFNFWQCVFMLLQTIAVIAAAIYAHRAYTQAKKIHNEQQQQNSKIHEAQLGHGRQQAFITLTAQVGGIRYIDETSPNLDEIAKAMNALDLISLLYFSNTADRDLLRSFYQPVFLDVFEQISRVEDMGMGRNGKETLIQDCPNTVRLYQKWKQKKSHRDNPRFEIENTEGEIQRNVEKQ